jgi:hypothetical protein
VAELTKATGWQAHSVRGAISGVVEKKLELNVSTEVVKKRGIWMGGLVPLGYDVSDRSLIVNEATAATVRKIYSLYLELGTVKRLKTEMDRIGLVTKARRHADGRKTGGVPFTMGHLYELLANPIYIGQIAHRGLHILESILRSSSAEYGTPCNGNSRPTRPGDGLPQCEIWVLAHRIGLRRFG